jgi:phosphatidylglycerophosphate synthase
MALAHLPIHPDVVSLAALLLGLFAAWLLADGRGIAGGILVQLASILVGVDGEIARLQMRDVRIAEVAFVEHLDDPDDWIGCQP